MPTYDHFLIALAAANYAMTIYIDGEDPIYRKARAATLFTAVVLTFVIVRRLALGYAALP